MKDRAWNEQKKDSLPNLYCEVCRTEEIITGCPFCLKSKIIKMEEELNFYKRELELIKE